MKKFLYLKTFYKLSILTYKNVINNENNSAIYL
jgi:hypothetical protein